MATVSHSCCQALLAPWAGETYSAPANPSLRLNPSEKQGAGGGSGFPEFPLIPVLQDQCPCLWQVLKSLQETVSKHNLVLPSVAAAPPPAAKPLAKQSFEVRTGGTRGPWHHCLGRAGRAQPGTHVSVCR